MKLLDTTAGHLLIGLVLFFSGILMVWTKTPGGDAVITGAVASIYTSMRNAGDKQ